MNDILYNLEKCYVKITLHSEKNISGYVVKNSYDFVLVNIVEDFHLDGFVLISKSFIKDVNYSKQEKFREQSFKKIGLEKEINYELQFSISNLKKVLNQLKNHIIILETIYKKKTWMFGKVLKCVDGIIYFEEIDSYGIKSRKIVKIKAEKITEIAFDNEYINMFEKYCIVKS